MSATTGYERGERVRGHEAVLDRAADVAVTAVPFPLHLLDVGCGDGRLLGELIVRVPYAESYVGVDPLPEALAEARRAADPRVTLLRAAVEALPFPDGSFDLVVSTLSFAGWADQRAGLAELARVVTDNGRVVLVERTGAVKQLTGLVAAVGLEVERTETVGRSVVGLPAVRAFILSPSRR